MTDQLFVQEEQDQYDLKTNEGYYIKSRSFIGSSTWLMGPNVVVVVEYLIAKASRSAWKFPCTFQKKEIWIQRGEVCISISRMVEEIKILTRQQVRDALEKLKWSHFLEDLTPPCVKGTRSYKHLRLCKYSDYQNPKNYENQLRTKSEPIKNHTGTTIEEYKESKEGKELVGDAPKKARSRKPSAPPPEQIQVFHEATGRYPNKILWPHVIKAIGEHTVAEVTPFYEAWILRSYNPTNLGWLFEWFVSGNIPTGKNGTGVYRTGQEATWTKGDDRF